ncbi:MAG TPA: MiaB/RimO family radical SAM methylthiotransferase, partial [Bacteroidia bacterium]
ISIMRGCDNMCSFCVVPFTRGRERSRDPESIVNEARSLFESGYREVTLLGQNVDSYLYLNGGLKKDIPEGEKKNAVNFAQLLERVADVHPGLRIRFSTSNPQDMSDEVLEVMAKHENICKYIHLPVQSGSTSMLGRMSRGYTREWYLDRIAAIRKYMPDCGISTDIITGFCGETEEEHRDTITLMQQVRYEFAFMFAYSERPNTFAEKKYSDDIPEELKKKRLQEVIDLQMKHSKEKVSAGVGKVHRVLAEGVAKKPENYLFGRNTQNTVVVFPEGDHKKGEYVNVLAESCTATTLIGKVV